ncbi:hypothetical protein ACFL35_10650 [Candidatus Riflebacteria bacterium]
MGKIGIFWLYKNHVIGNPVSIEMGEESVTGLIDSLDAHYEFWETCAIQKEFPELRYEEYENIPRGRVLYNSITQEFEIFMDNKLFEIILKEIIIKYFDLKGCKNNWKTDPHYTTDPEEIEKIFEFDLDY